MPEQICVCQAPALHQRQGTGGAQGSSRVGLPSPNRFHLDVPHPAQKNLFVLIFKGGQRMAKRVLGPALWIGFRRLLEESIEGAQQIRRQLRNPKLANQISRLTHDEIVAISESLTKWRDAVFFSLLTECVQSSHLFFKTALASHASSLAEELSRGLLTSERRCSRAWHPVQCFL